MHDVFVHELGAVRGRGGRHRDAHLGFRARARGRPPRADRNICDGVFVEGGVVVGDRVTVKCGVQLWQGVEA